MCKVSVIIAAYNAENFIERAINSIQYQTFQNFEIIVCDDCSTDATVEVVQKMMKDDDRITLIQNQQNLRAGASRNRCINVARGDYIAIQDADDFSHPNRLKMQVEFLNDNSLYDFVSSQMIKFDENDDWNELSNQNNKINDRLYKLPYKQSPENKDFLFRLPYAHASTMFRKHALLLVNGYRVASETVRGQDADMFMRLHARGSRGYNLKLPLYYYLEGEDAFKRKKFIYRMHTVKIRYKGFKAMGLLPLGYIYLLKPLLVGMIPIKILKYYRG